MNRSKINARNADTFGRSEALRELEQSVPGTFPNREVFQKLGECRAETLYSRVTRPLFVTGWMRAWDENQPAPQPEAEQAIA